MNTTYYVYRLTPGVQVGLVFALFLRVAILVLAVLGTVGTAHAFLAYLVVQALSTVGLSGYKETREDI